MKKILLSLIVSYFISILSYAQAGRENILRDLEQGQGSREVSDQQKTVTGTTKSAARLFGAKDDLTSVIMIIPSGSEVAILDSDSTYFRVNYDDSEGFVLKRQVTVNTEAADNQNVSTGRNINTPKNEPDISAREDSKEAYPVETNRESRFSYLERKYGTSMAARINSGKIWKGMDADMVRDSWGNPTKINRIINGNTIQEEWTYRNSVLYFGDSILRNWGPVRK